MGRKTHLVDKDGHEDLHRSPSPRFTKSPLIMTKKMKMPSTKIKNNNLSSSDQTLMNLNRSSYDPAMFNLSSSLGSLMPYSPTANPTYSSPSSTFRCGCSRNSAATGQGKRKRRPRRFFIGRYRPLFKWVQIVQWKAKKTEPKAKERLRERQTTNPKLSLPPLQDCHLPIATTTPSTPQTAAGNEPPQCVDWTRFFGFFHEQNNDMCWLFAVVDYLEALYCIQRREKIILSRQELLDKCSPGLSDGGAPYQEHPYVALQWIEMNGLSKEESYNFRFQGRLMDNGRRSDPPRVVNVRNIIAYSTETENGVLKRLDQMPLIGTFYYYETEYARVEAKPEENIYTLTAEVVVKKDGVFVKDGVFAHTVVVVGYKTLNGVNCYCVRDPLKDCAPGSGYYYVRRHSSCTGNQICPIHELYGVEVIF